MSHSQMEVFSFCKKILDVFASGSQNLNDSHDFIVIFVAVACVYQC